MCWGGSTRARQVMPAGSGTEALKLEFSTVHRAKGREADYVVVLDLKDGYRRFPVEDNGRSRPADGAASGVWSSPIHSQRSVGCSTLPSPDPGVGPIS